MIRWLTTALLLFASFARAAEPEILDPAVAFKFSAKVVSDSSVEVTYDIAPGYYLYREKFAFVSESAKLGDAQIPNGKVKHDEFFGRIETLRDKVRIVIPYTSGGNSAGPWSLSATSQGCADVGVCFPPNTERVAFKSDGAVSVNDGGGFAALDAAAPSATLDAPPVAGLEPTASAAARTADSNLSETDRIAQLLQSNNFWLIVASFFGFGVLLSFTPCVLPMIPILSGLIVGEGENVGKGRAFSLSVAYVLGMAVTYAIAGVIAGLSGALLSTALQNPWVLGIFALVFVLLALSMFGMYELQLPASAQNALTTKSNRLPGGKFIGVTFMGVLSALIVSPCVAAPLAGALVYLSQSHDVMLGGAALFVMALGMGLPLLLVGASAGAFLPRSGVWMESVKHFFGVLLLAVAIWLITPVIPSWAVMSLWSLLLIGSAMFLHAIDPLPDHTKGYRRLWKGVGVASLVGGIALLIGVLSGTKDPLQPLAGLTGGGYKNVAHESLFQRVKSGQELDQRLAAAKGKYLMLDFYADWCISCKEMERFTFADSKVRERLKDVVLLQVDVTANNADDKALLQRFGLFGPPGIILFDREGKEIRSFRVIGYQSSDQFIAGLARAQS
ncbi:MAG: protein-disulfide reductase DsbD [Pseudomonadota bacterium]|nr:protein-disulfide reductase DsbD [Pseudomonadota bacterium]